MPLLRDRDDRPSLLGKVRDRREDRQDDRGDRRDDRQDRGTGATTGATGATTGKTVVAGPGCSGNRGLDVHGGHAAARSVPWRLQAGGATRACREGVAMAVKTEGGVSASPAARASGKGSVRAGTVEQLSRADRVARGKDARAWRRWSRMRSSRRPGRGIRWGCCWGRRSRGCRSWCRSGTGGCWCRRSRSTGARRCRWRRTWPPRPASGLRVQLCGDAHLSNFGAFASPERRLVFDVNDFDETLPGPFEWDVKRLAASLAVAGRDNGFPAKARRKIALAAAEGYRTAMRGFARAAAAGGLVRAPGHRAGHRRAQVPGQGEKVQGRRGDAGQGPHPRQHAGAGQADHRGRRAAADHQRPAADRPDRGGLRRCAGRRGVRAAPRGAGQVPAHSAVRPAAPAGAVHAGPGGPQGRRGRQRRHPRLGLADGRPATGSSRCSCRPRRPSRRCWPTTAGAASTPTRASGSSPGST